MRYSIEKAFTKVVYHVIMITLWNESQNSLYIWRSDNVNIIKVKNYEELSIKAAKIIIEAIHMAPNLVLGFPTGSTPVGLYQELIKAYNDKKTSFRYVKSFVLDEYCNISYNIEQSSRYFMNYNLFNHVNILEENIFSPNTSVDDLEEVCEQFDKVLAENPIDIQVLGIGVNGHIGFNEPGSDFESTTHISKLAFKTRWDNQRFFNSLNDVPAFAVTMGIKNIMNAKQIILLISGACKKEAYTQLMSLTEPNNDFPASVLLTHPNVTIIVDEDAYQG